jgi:hypothetical protein
MWTHIHMWKCCGASSGLGARVRNKQQGGLLNERAQTISNEAACVPFAVCCEGAWCAWRGAFHAVSVCAPAARSSALLYAMLCAGLVRGGGGSAKCGKCGGNVGAGGAPTN